MSYNLVRHPNRNKVDLSIIHDLCANVHEFFPFRNDLSVALQLKISVHRREKMFSCGQANRRQI